MEHKTNYRYMGASGTIYRPVIQRHARINWLAVGIAVSGGAFAIALGVILIAGL